ncbi:PTS sugar transporter subunit IIA [Clostridium ganghwense]|uniref:PTS glucose transporter subunit IIA n=1 Tax=Clostridium ganghwense TaxID=312089 RepID=A0ABT4CJN3_9CLOT|nr:PTS glucose transporter subunit IIA [Clostridium ganghwense]MCY6369123.1 PTS glucose transporter subunit IIA [Clostridium ganghwense]
MFGFFKKAFKLVAPVDGKVIDLSKVPDEVFSQRLVGDGVAIDSTGDTIVAPADGVLKMIFKTNHAFALVLENRAEILVHIGLDTVALNGYGFERIAEEGKRVKKGEPIIRINRQAIEEKGCSLITPVLITNMEIIDELNFSIDKDVRAGADEVVTYKTK